ncbi:spondin domain-containing protein [Massilia sp. P8910]|uniref:spondin domain-containing protein n=1 Tax=Massilia antarctica TaxID=2765360 RepID=UPI001E4F5CDA|nr:spondin domain-containing protein [Massilia antarctica]MCE3605357.1 spondin domain-containing protein [Massilia antarctica]
MDTRSVSVPFTPAATRLHRFPMTSLQAALAAGALFLLHGAAQAADISVTVTNLTRATWFTPLLVTAHPAAFKPFTAGSAASVEIQQIAEAGNTAPMEAILPVGAARSVNPHHGPLKPGATSLPATLTGGAGTANGVLSILAMMVPTNDGFVAMNGVDIPTTPGTYVYTLNAYDAGTEANDEKAAAAGGINQPGMIFPPFLNDANGNLASTINIKAPGFVNASKEGFIHIHRGILGSAAGGASALDNTVYRWLNPVARVVLTVK